MNCCITYKSGYKYQLIKDFKIILSKVTGYNIKSDFIELNDAGLLVIKAGYAWDGPSGPTIDTNTFMKGSLVHDVLYQLIREQKLSHDYRVIADQILYDLCREDNMNYFKAKAVYYAVRWFADPASSPSAERPIEFAPKSCQECIDASFI